MKKLFLFLSLFCTGAFANITDIKIGVYQIAQISLGGTSTTLVMNTRSYATFNSVDSSTASWVTYDQPKLDAMVAAGQYFKLIKKSTIANSVSTYALVVANSDGTVAATANACGEFLKAASGAFLYRTGVGCSSGQTYGSGSSKIYMITPNAGYAIPSSTAVSFSGGLSPNQAQLDGYTPPSSTPINVVGESVPVGTGFAGGGTTAAYSSSITAAQQTQITSIGSRVNSMTNGNKLYIEEKIGTTGSIVNIEQVGKSNIIQGAGTANASIDGLTNKINIKQGSSTGTGKNMTEFGVKGNNNTLNVWQARNVTNGSEITTGIDASQHYALATINGNNNSVSIKQANANSVSGISSGHFASVSVTGSTNTLTLLQTDSGQKQIWETVSGNSNELYITQQGAGTKYLDITASGGSNKVTVNQTGTGQHKGTIALTNGPGGGGNVLNLTQQGTANQIYSISQTCAIASGCSVTLVQGQ